jgi:uncharacterized protein (UPF0332 family)
MAFDWGLYLNLAEELKEFRNDQAKLRTAISRAYYSAFIKARNQSTFSTLKGPETHKKVMDFYKENQDPSAYTIGNNLDSLRKIRNNADYDSHFETSWQEVEQKIKLAKNILEKLGNFEAE